MSDYEKPLFRREAGKPPSQASPALPAKLVTEDRGLRFNEGKLRESLFPVEVLEELLKILEAGSVKYGDHNWKKGLPYMEVFDSLTRHLRAWQKGEDIDQEDGRLHIAKVAINASFITYFQLMEMGKFDDRGKK